jgi:hypothetical protein
MDKFGIRTLEQFFFAIFGENLIQTGTLETFLSQSTRAA